MLLGRVVFPGRCLTSNQLRRLHWREAGRLKRKWRDAAVELWGVELRRSGQVLDLAGGEVRQSPFEGPVSVRSGAVMKGVLPDCGAWFPSVEAAVNGLVDAGGLVDDSSEYVAQIVFDAPRRPNPDEDEHVWVEIHQFTPRNV